MKNYVVIGASTGIGRQLALDLAAQPDTFVFGTFHKNEPTETIAQLEYHQLDVMADDWDLSFFPEKIDGLVYCPGSIALKPFGRIKAAEFVEDYKLQVVGQ